MTIDKNTKIYLGQTEIVKIKKGDVVIWEKSSGPVVEPDYMYIENTYAGQNTVNIGGGVDSIQYSKDKSNWTTISAAQSITLNEGEKLYLRGDSGATNGLHIQGSNSHIVGGNINTLLDYVDPNNATIYNSCFASMFSEDYALISAGDLILPATTLAESCYSYMFQYCSSLTSAPALPATTLAESCYRYMFENCTALTTAPALPATTLATSCYSYMFEYCSSLTSAPALPATTLVEYCYYYMFRGCSTLTTAPALPATTLAGGCYRNMFNGCTALNSVTVYANDNSATYCTNNWLKSVAATGTFYNYGSATYTTGISGIPSGWTEVKPAA